jgi:hypothetical protein
VHGGGSPSSDETCDTGRKKGGKRVGEFLRLTSKLVVVTAWSEVRRSSRSAARCGGLEGWWWWRTCATAREKRKGGGQRGLAVAGLKEALRKAKTG